MIAQFALRLISGISLMWVLMPRAEVTCGFFRIQMMLVLGLSVLAAWMAGGAAIPIEPDVEWLPTTALRTLCIATAVLAYVGSVLWTLDKRRPGTAMAVGILILSSASLLGTMSSTETFRTAAGWLAIASEFSSAAILGAAMTGMLLGHWYLTAPTMSIRPLSTLTLLFGITVAFRLVLSSVGGALAWPEIAGGTQWTWFALRWIAGVIGPLAVFWMTWRILKYRNTQAATGVLFVGVILTFLGELSSLLLYRELQLAV